MDLSTLSELAPRLLGMLGLLLLSALFSGSETALFSLSRVQRERLARSDSSVERYVTVLLKDPRRVITTVLLGNELVNITFSSISAGVWDRLFRGWGLVAVTIMSTLITVPLLLIVGEITPKSIALRVNEGWARVIARPLGFLAIVLLPVRLVVSTVASLIARLLGGKGGTGHEHTKIGEAEFKTLVDVSSREGALEDAEHQLIKNVFAFRDRTVAEIMTPSPKVYSLSFDLPLVRIAQEATKSGYARIPVYQRKKDNIVGILFSKDLVGLSSGRLAGKTVKDLLRPPVYCPKTTKCDGLFREFQRTRTHMALVVDEYGRQIGLVTMEDLLEELFGETKEEKRRRAVPVIPPTGEVVKLDAAELAREPDPAPSPPEPPAKGDA